jgi:hypothetical protein
VDVRGPSIRLLTVALSSIGLCVFASATAPAPAAAGGVAAGTPPGTTLEEILRHYNEGIRRALAGIDSLRVAQTMFEPQDDGSTKRACAVLVYSRAHGMTRTETFSELIYPVGEYALTSVVGPELDPSAYSVEYAGLDEEEGVSCHRLEVTATDRDYRHFDGSIWISARDFAPVRVVGEVADPPFPAREIRLDKTFVPGPHDLWLVRSHRGWGEFKLLFISKRGERQIYYDDYVVEFSEPVSISHE